MPRRVVCALLDSGVDVARLPSRHASRAPSMRAVDGAGGWMTIPPKDALGHGTADATLLLDASPWIDVTVWRVFDDDPRGSFDRIVSALQAAFRSGAEIIACPLGTPDPLLGARIESIVDIATTAGTVVVAPLSFHGLPSFPGACPGAVGVVVDPAARDDAPLRDGHRFRASPRPPEEFSGFPAGPSFAAVRVAAHLARLRAESSC